jgi:hypothetical protein
VANTLNARPFDQVAIDLRKAGLTEYSIRFLRDTLIRSDKVLTDEGAVQNVAPIVGRTEGLGTTAQHLDVTGKLIDTDAIAADGTGSPLTGGKRGFVALDTNNRLADSFRNTAVNVSNTPTSATTLSNNGVATVINIAASTNKFGPGNVSYNSGSVDPGIFGTYYVYADDPTFAGGAVTYQFSTDISVLTAAEGRIPFGKIITAFGAPGTGGGHDGGGGKGYS